MGKLIEKIDSSLDNIIDDKLEDLKNNKITDIEFFRQVTLNDPYYIRNKTLYNFNSSVIQTEIATQKNNQKLNPPFLSFNIDSLISNRELFVQTFPELKTVIEELEISIAKDECKGCAKGKFYSRIHQVIVQLYYQDLKSNYNRDLSILKNIVPNTFIENWTKELKEYPIKTPKFVTSFSEEEKEAMQISSRLMMEESKQYLSSSSAGSILYR